MSKAHIAVAMREYCTEIASGKQSFPSAISGSLSMLLLQHDLLTLIYDTCDRLFFRWHLLTLSLDKFTPCDKILKV